MRLTSIAKLPLFIGLRYSFSRRRNRFIGVVSMVSLVGMALGVGSLIVVLSVMNGFADELRGRILSLIPHATLIHEDASLSASMDDWEGQAAELGEHPLIKGVAPFVEAKVLLSGPRFVQGAQLVGIDPERETGVSQVANQLTKGNLEQLSQQRWGIVLGSLLARSLSADVGDTIELTAPLLTRTPLGSLPRRKRFEVVGIFEVGAQLDGSYAMIALADAQTLLQRDTPDGLRLAFDDLLQADAHAAELNKYLGPGFRVVPWQEAQRSLFSAVRMEKTMVALLLLSVVAVAAFNIVSTLSMAVTEKRADIAVLRTMGARKPSIMLIFICQGMSVSLMGVVLGCVLGCLIALNIADITLYLEQLIGVKLFDPQVYFISNLPARLDLQDVTMAASLAILLSFLATLIPAARASGVDPAEILRYE